MTNESMYQPPPPYSPPVKKPSTFVKILPWVLLPVAFLLGVGAGASGNESEEEPKEDATTSEEATTPTEIQAQEAEEEPSASVEEETFLLMLETVATSSTIDTVEDSEALILFGRKVCFWFDEGTEYDSVILLALGEADTFGLDSTGVGEVVGAAISALCTEYLVEVTG